MLKALNGRRLTFCLGILWLIDGLAQLQPKMFTSQFPNQIIVPNMVGQPYFVSSPIHFFVHIFLLNPVLFNCLIIVAQIALGVLILYKATSKVGLKLSILWALFVWSIGEAYGGLFGLNSNLIMGLPGAAILYVILAIAAIEMINPKSIKKFKSYWLIFSWAIIWLIGAIYQLLPSQASVPSLASMINGTAGQPAWLFSLKSHLANVLSGLAASGGHSMTMMGHPGVSGGYWFVLLVVAVEIIIGVGALIPRKESTLLVWFGILVSFIFWIIGQNLGGYYSGLATDPNSGPLIILVGLVILSFPNRVEYLNIMYRRINNILI